MARLSAAVVSVVASCCCPSPVFITMFVTFFITLHSQLLLFVSNITGKQLQQWLWHHAIKFARWQRPAIECGAIFAVSAMPLVIVVVMQTVSFCLLFELEMIAT